MIVNVYVKETVGKTRKVIQTDVSGNDFNTAVRVIMQGGVFNKEVSDVEGTALPVTTVSFYPPNSIDKIVYEDHTTKKL